MRFLWKRTMMVILMLACLSTSLYARADKTQYPVFMVHGVLGWTKTLGTHYFGDDFGTFVGDTCSFLEISCNRLINPYQEVYEIQLTSLQGSYYRGLELYEAIMDEYLHDKLTQALGVSESWWLNKTPAQIQAAITAIPPANLPHVNLIGHSQGGVDCRYAAKLMADTFGYPVVKVLITVSSPHRGSGIAGSMYQIKDTNPLFYSSALWFFEEAWCGILAGGYRDGKEQEGEEMLKSMAFYDIVPTNATDDGMETFNNVVPVSNAYASKYVSFATAAPRNTITPIMQLFNLMFGDIDGNVYEMDPALIDTCNRQNTTDLADDDGFIPIYSQQMGIRMRYNHYFWLDDQVSEINWLGDLRDLNHPNRAQMGDPEQNGTDGVIPYGHFQEITLPFGLVLNDARGVAFDELGYYSAMIDYIAQNE